MNSHRHIILSLLFFCALLAQAQEFRMWIEQTSHLATGDLLFVLNRSGNHITEVTAKESSLPIDHVGIFYRDSEGNERVVEAVPQRGVCITPIDSFLLQATQEREPDVIVGRLKNKVDVDMTEIVSHALSYVGKPYDDIFMPDDSAIYCSELVTLCYRNKNGESVFTPIGMNFTDANGVITPYWKDFYHRRGLTVPQGEPGSNPANIATSDKLTLIYQFYH